MFAIHWLGLFNELNQFMPKLTNKVPAPATEMMLIVEIIIAIIWLLFIMLVYEFLMAIFFFDVKI